MKNRGFMFAILMVSASAFGARPGIALRLEQLALGGAKLHLQREVRIYSNGDVVRLVTERNETGEKHYQTKFTNLSRREMRNIEDLIEDARTGKIEYDRNHALCLIAPDSTHRHTADNGSILLKSGHFCLGFKRNTSVAAKELVTILDGFDIRPR